MNYGKIYKQIINNAKQRVTEGYTELHHIIPRSLGGGDEPENIVALTAREHFICHYLLAKMYTHNSYNWHKMNHAFMMMCPESGTQQRYFNSHLYESLRSNFSLVMSEAQTGSNNSQFGTRWIHNPAEKRSKKIPKGDSLPEGWKEGRIINFDKKVVKRNKRKLIAEQFAKEANELYRQYKDGNFASIRDFCRQGYYDRSHVSLTKLWKKYVPEYNPSKGKAYILDV